MNTLHVPLRLVFARGGIDVLTVQEAGLAGEDDRSHLALATAQGRVIFTQDDDFLRLHVKGSRTPALSMGIAECLSEMSSVGWCLSAIF